MCICGPVSMRYRSSETNFQYGYRYKCIYGCLSTANKVFVCLFDFCLFVVVVLLLLF